MTVLLPPNPRTIPGLTCNPASIRACGVDLLAASSQLDDLGSFAAGGARIGDWHGTDSTSYHDTIRGEGATADRMSLALRKVAQTVDDHADAMQGLTDRREDLVERRAGLERAISELRTAIEGASVEEEPALQGRSDGITTRVEQFDADVATWVTDIETAETTMINAFTSVTIMEQVDRRYADAVDRRTPRWPASRGTGPPLRRSSRGGRACRRRRRTRSSRPLRRRSATSTASRPGHGATPTRWPSTGTSTSGGCCATATSSPAARRTCCAPRSRSSRA